MLFSLKTHREVFASADHGDEWRSPWPIGLALATLAGVTVLVALVSEIFVESVQKAAEDFGMTPAFVGFIVVALVGGAAEMASAFSGARKNRLDLSVGIALGSASQIALFVAPVLVLLSYVIGPAPMDLQFWPGAVVMMLIATMTAMFVTVGGRSAWFVGVLVLMVYLIFAMTLYLLPPQAHDPAGHRRELDSTRRASDVTETLNTLLKISLVIFMAGNLLDMGLRLRVGTALVGLRNLRFVSFGLLWCFVLGPAVAWALTRLIPLALPYAMGLILIGLTPCAPFLPMMVERARGDMGYTARSERSVRRIRGCGAIAPGWAASSARRRMRGTGDPGASSSMQRR